jgi:predicted porin
VGLIACQRPSVTGANARIPVVTGQQVIGRFRDKAWQSSTVNGAIGAASAMEVGLIRHPQRAKRRPAEVSRKGQDLSFNPRRNFAMKKTLLAIAALGLFAGAASAQSNVTLFGVVDLNLRSVKNGSLGSIKTESTDGVNSSRFGFKGVEDLGGGMKAQFWYEAGVNPDVGTTNSKLFNRRSTISLIGNFGEVRLGRDYTPTFRGLASQDPFGTNGLGSFTNMFAFGSISTGSAALGSPLFSGATTLVRADNSIAYWLPGNIGGVYGEVMIAANEGAATATAANKYVGGRLGWAAGPIDVFGVYGKTTLVQVGGSDGALKQFILGASYNFGVAKVNINFNSNKTNRELGVVADGKSTIWQLGGVIPMGPGEIHVAYDVTKGSGDLKDSGAKMFAATYLYNLSPRTALYGTFAHLKNNTFGNFSLGAGVAGPQGSLYNKSSTGYEFGVRHFF